MSVSVDFGSREIRSLVRSGIGARLRLTSVPSEYLLVPDAVAARRLLQEEGLPHAVCGSGLAVFGGGLERAAWLARGPAVPLFVDGRIPTRDGLARQILGVLTESVLPEPAVRGETCVVAAPGAGLPGNLRQSNEDFLGHLVQLRGYQPVFLKSAEAVVLAAGAPVGFSGVFISAGAESTSHCVARQGRIMADGGTPLGGRWLDGEMAREFEEWTWDEAGERHANTSALESWRLNCHRSQNHQTEIRKVVLTRLISLMSRRIAAGVRQSLRESGFDGEPVPVLLAGGLSLLPAFREGLQLELSAARKNQHSFLVQTTEDAETAVVRGGLIFSELESRSAA